MSDVHWHKPYEGCYEDCPEPHRTDEEAREFYNSQPENLDFRYDKLENNKQEHICCHSMFNSDCLGCWEVRTYLLNREINRLRLLMLQSGDEDLKERLAQEDRIHLGANAPPSSKARW